MRSDKPEPPAVAIVRQNGLSSASSRASVADTPVSRQIWWTQVVDRRPQVRLHSCEGRSPSLILRSWHRFGRSGLPVHHFEVWRHDQKDPVFVYRRCMRRRTGRYGAKLHRWTRSRASWCAGYVIGNGIWNNRALSFYHLRHSKTTYEDFLL